MDFEDQQTDAQTAPDKEVVRCAHSGELVAVSECVEIGGRMIHHRFKDQCVDALRQGVVPNPTTANTASTRPKSVFWSGVFFSFAPLQLHLAYRAFGEGPQLYSVIWSFTIPTFFLISAVLIWFHGRRKLTFYVATLALALAVSRGLWSQAFPDPHFHGIERTMLPGLLVMGLLLWRFSFGVPSRAYFGLKTK